MIYCTNCGTANEPGAVFCSSCGQAMSAPATEPAPPPPPPPQPSPPPPYAAPPYAAPPAATAAPPTIAFVPSPPPPRSNTLWWAVGFVALALLAGGITYAVVREDSPTTGAASTTDSRVDDTGAPPSTGASTEPASTTTLASTTTAAPPDPLSVLEFTRAADAPVVESFVGQWVPQVSAKRPGIEDDGIVYQLTDIVALHQQLVTQHGAVLLFSGDYNYQSGDLWVSIVPQGSPTPDGALQFCVDQGIGRDDCFAKFITHDLSITDTVELQP